MITTVPSHKPSLPNLYGDWDGSLQEGWGAVIPPPSLQFNFFCPATIASRTNLR